MQLYRYVSQMVDLYKYLLEEHSLKALHIKPYNILLSARGQLKVYHLVTSRAVGGETGKSRELPTGHIIGSRAKQPGMEDLLDLGQFVYFLCTQESLLPSANDFDYVHVKQKIDEWLEEYYNQCSGK